MTTEIEDKSVETDPDLEVSAEPGLHPAATGIGAVSGGTAGAAIGTMVGGPVGTVVGAVVGAVVGGTAGAVATGHSTEEEKPKPSRADEENLGKE